MNIYKLSRNGLLMLLALLQAGCSVFGIRTEETPKYEVLFKQDDKEIRAYSSYIVARTQVKGEFKEAQNEAFRILAGYIFGKNEQKQKISMTAPVVQEASAQSEKIAMTAPVVMQAPSAAGWEMTFMMPSKYKISDLPRPKDERIQFEEIPAQTIAVIRYSGFGSESTNNKKAQELQSWITEQKKYEAVSGPSWAGYDPPWTIPFLRRNEMMITLK